MMCITRYMHRQIMFYLMLFFCAVSASQSEFPCTFPCDWINKTFTLFYTNRLNSIEPVTNMTFNADGTTGTLFSELKTQCFQISDEFLILRVISNENDEISDIYSLFCIPIAYTSGQSNFTMHFKDSFREVVNQTVALNETQLCEICGTGLFSSFETVLALEQPSPAPNVIPTAPCEVPSNCQSDSGIVCPQGGSIPKECFDDTTTTDKTITTTVAHSTITTSDTPTTNYQTQPTTTTLDTPTTSSQTQPTTTNSDTSTTSSQTQLTTTTSDNPTTSSQTQPTTTTSDTLTTSSQTQPITTTTDNPTTTRAKKPCGRRGRFHRHGQ